MGQDGAYLAKFLLSKKYQVYGAYRPNSYYKNNRLKKLGIENKINLIANRGKNSWFNAAKKFMEIVNNK